MPDRTHPSPPVTESHYRQVVQSAVDYAIVSCDPQGRVTSWNEGARRVLGWSEAEMLGQPIQRFFTPEDVAQEVAEQEMVDAVVHGRAMDERWHMRKNGERFWASGELMPLLDTEGGQIVGFVKILRDHTELRLVHARLRQLNDTLRDSEARLQMALDVGGMGVWQWDLRTDEVQWWPGMETIHGLAAGSNVSRLANYLRIVHPADRRSVVDAIREVFGKKSGQQVEYRVVWPDGSVRWLEARSKVLMSLEGELRSVSGVCLDITRRKRVESDLKFLASASVELAGLSDYQSTLEKIARLAVPQFADWCAIDMVGEGGALQRVAVAHADPHREFLVRELHVQFPPRPDRITGAGPWHVLLTGKAERVAEISADMLGRIIPQADYLAALRALGLRSYLGVPLAARGKTLGVISFVTAESGRRYTAEDQVLAEDLAARAAVAIENASLIRAMQESDRAKDVFLATLAHELRNPLAPVWNGLSIIKRVPGDTVRVRQVADMIERQVGQMAHLVDDLLDVSRIATGKIELRKQVTDLGSILRSALDTSRPHIDAAGHKLSLHLPDEPMNLMADPGRLAQVFANLLNNAAKYTRPGGHIEVEVRAQPDLLVCSVRDDGAGIPREMLDKVFGLFIQANHPAQPSQGGMGIGLSLVQGLVHLHGGTVEVRSEGPDRGSEFIVSLPRTQVAAAGGERSNAPSTGAPQQPAPQVPSPAIGNQPRRVLVVDDNHDAASTLAELLEMLGSEVSVAHDGAGALAEVSRVSPDVVLLDIGLPDIDGYEVARRIRALEGLSQPRLIALTGWGQAQDKRQALQAGFDEHWTKPVDPQRLQTL